LQPLLAIRILHQREAEARVEGLKKKKAGVGSRSSSADLYKKIVAERATRFKENLELAGISDCYGQK
jgi:hypothetical protein